MAMDPSKVGSQSSTFVHQYDWRCQAIYALGIGAGPEQLEYLYERHPGGMKAFPTYAVVPAFEAAVALLLAVGVDLEQVVHGGQKIRLHRPLPVQGTLSTVGTLAGIYDLKRLASLRITTRSTLGGEPLVDTEWNVLVRGAGGFGGPRPPKDPDSVAPPKGVEADWVVEQSTRPEQALLYRLSGDTNPLHADPELAARAGFEQGPILHGLCTLGFVARAAARRTADGDATRLRAMGAQFRKPVWPGDTIVTVGYELGEGKVALQAFVKGRPDPVVTGAWATFAA